MRRNKIDYADLAENNRAAFIEVAKTYLSFLEKNPSVMPGGLPFGLPDIVMASKLNNRVSAEMEKKAVAKIVSGLSTNFDNWMNSYIKRHKGALLKDIGQMALLTTATSFASAPEMWLKYAEGHDEIHPADLVMHTLFAGMMSRTPYFIDGANPYLAAHAEGKPMTKEMQNIQLQMQAKDALRHLGIRDSSLVMTGDDGMVPDVANSPSPLKLDDMLNDAAGIASDSLKMPQGPLNKGEEPSWEPIRGKYELENPGAQQGPNVISFREVAQFVKWVRARIASGAKVSDLLTNPQELQGVLKSGTLTEDAVKNNPTAMRTLVQTLGHFKEKLYAEGVLNEGEQFGYTEMVRAGSDYYRGLVAKASRLISMTRNGHGVQDMLAAFAPSKDGRRGGISYIEGLNTEGRPELQNMVDAYNEFVKIVQDFGSASVELNGNGTPISTVVDFKENPAKAKELEELVVSLSDVFQSELDLPSLHMGNDKLHRALIEGLLSTKLEHSVIFGHDGGVLFGRDGQHVDLDHTLVNWLVDSGVGIVRNDAGKDVIITRLIDLSGYEDGAGPDRPSKADIIRNLLRYAEATGKVHVRWYKEGDEGVRIGKETFDKYFDSGMELVDARGDRRFKKAGGLDGMMRELGMVFDHEDITNAMIRQIHKARNSEVTETQWRLIDLLKQVGLYRKDKLGRAVMMMAARAEGGFDRTGEGEFELGFDITHAEYQDIVDQLGKNHLVPLLGREDFDFLMREVKQLSDLGVLRLSMPQAAFEGEGVTPGTFVIVGQAHEPIMNHFVSEVQNLRMRGIEEMYTDFYDTIKALEGGLENAKLKGAGGKGWKNRRKNMERLLDNLKLMNKIGPQFFVRADKLMIDSGILQLGKGYKAKKLYVPSNEKLMQMINDVEKFFVDELHRTIGGDIQLEMMDAQQAAAEIRARSAKTTVSDRHSLGEFMIGTGLSMSDASHTDALRALREAPAAARNLYRGSEDMVQYVRGQLNRVIDQHYVGALADRMKQLVSEYSDNYIVSLTEEAQSTPQRVIRFERGTEFPENIRGGGDIGQSPRKVGPVLKERGKGASRTNYEVIDRLVMASSRDNNMGRYGDWAFIDSESFGVSNPTDPKGGADVFSKLKKMAFSRGFGPMRRKLPGGGVAEESFGRAVLIREMRQGGGHKAFAVPDTVAKAERFVTEIEAILRAYGEHIGSTSQISEPLTQLRFILDELRLAIPQGDRAVENFSIRGSVSEGRQDLNDSLPYRMEMWENAFTFLQLHEYFGQESLVKTFNAAKDPGKDPLWNMVVRASLANNAKSVVTDRMAFNAALRSYVGTRSHVSWADLSGRYGMTVDDAGNLAGFRTLVYDNAAASAELGRAMNEADGAVIMHPRLLEALWHSKGFEVLNVREEAENGHGTARTVAKIRFYDRNRGLLVTKDVAMADPTMLAFMEENSIGMIMTKDAIKEIGGEWEQLVADATIRIPDGQGGYSHDLPGAISEGRTAGWVGEAMEIPLESTIWTHPVDNEVEYSSRAPNLSSFRTEDQVGGMVSEIYGKIDGIAAEFADQVRLSGATSSELMALHYMYVRDEGTMDSMERRNASGSIASYYVRQGGPFATGMHYGRNRQAIEVIKNKVIADKLLKMRSANGTQAVYGSDTKRVLRPGEAVAPSQFDQMMGDLYTMHVGYRMGEDIRRDADGNVVRGEDGRAVMEPGTERARRINRQVHGWEGQDRFQDDSITDPAQRAERDSDIIHVPLFRGGRGGGIYHGLMELRNTSRRDPGRFALIEEAHRQDASDNQPNGRPIARNIRRALTRRGDAQASDLAATINDMWQMAMTNPEADAVVRVKISNLLRGNESIVEAEVAGIVDEIMDSRQAFIGGINNGVPGADPWPWLHRTVNNKPMQYIRNGSVRRGLAALFGEYDYGATQAGTNRGAGTIDYGITAMTQRHPSSMISDSIAVMVRGVFGAEWGNQTRMNYYDAEMKQKADQDEDHIHFYGDYTAAEISGALFNRETTPGFTEVDRGEIRARDFFNRREAVAGREGGIKNTRGSFVDEVIDNLNRGKIGIGLVSKAITTTSAMLYKDMAMKYRHNGLVYAVAPNAAYDEQLQDIVFTTEHGLTVMDRVQQNREPLDYVTRLQNRYLDAKKVRVGADPRELDLQMEIMSQFYGLFVQDPTTGTWRRVTEGVGHNTIAQEILVGMASPLYMISSLGKDVTATDGSRQMKYSEALRLSSRYDVIHGPDVRHREQAIADYVSRHLVNELGISIGKKQGKLAGAELTPQLREAVSDLAVITPASSLQRRTVYDAMAEGILRSERRLNGKSRHPFLLDEEIASMQGMQEFARVASPELKTADAARFVANYQDLPNVYKEMDNRRRNGERMLAAEAGAARRLLKASDNYWKATESESAFDRGTRVQPENPLEAEEAARDAVDATGINIARTMASAFDKANQRDREMRLEEAYAIRRALSGDFSALINSRDATTDPRKWRDMESVKAVLYARVKAYLEKWGRDGNLVPAALDLMVPEFLGKYTDKFGVNRVRYKKFNPMILDAIIAHSAFGGDMTVDSRVAPPDILANDGGPAELMKIMAMSAHLAEATYTHNPDALSRVSAINEMVQTNGRSMLAALHVRDLKTGRSRKMLENIYLASMNREVGRMVGEQEGTPFTSMGTNEFGFRTSDDAERFLRDAITGRGEPLRVRIVSEQHQKPSFIPEYLKDDFDDALATFSVSRQVDNTLGTNQRILRGSIRERIRSEELSKPKNKRREMTSEELANEVRKIESKFLREALSTIDATKQPKVKMSTSDVYGTDIIQHQRRLRAERRNGRVC